MDTAYADMMFAHQGGWDELLYALAPIGLIFGLLRLASSRAKKLAPPEATTQTEPD
jgi:hypothetical protein